MQGLGLFSGIGGFELAMSRAGIDLVGMCEINPRCRQVLSRQFEDVPIYEDVKNVSINALGYDYGDINIITGGFPCQDVSVAGKRKGLVGDRSGLWFPFLRIIREALPQWVVIENVPGLLTSNKGKDFETILNGLVDVGYSLAWRCLDAQFFGLAQKRRRLFIVGHLAGGSAAQVLFEQEGYSRHIAEGRAQGEEIAYTLTTRIGRSYNVEDNLVPVYYTETHQQDRIYSPQGKSPALLSTLSGGAHRILQGTKVRRLTPVECARLQGFPDDWCEGLSDTAQYEAYGNAVAVPVVEWILNRIVEASA